MKPSEILKAAKAVIENPDKWTQGAFARDTQGNRLPGGYGDEATCFCSLGAVEKATQLDWYDTPDIVVYLEEAIDDQVAHFNDSASHADVMQMFDKAITLAESEGN